MGVSTLLARHFQPTFEMQNLMDCARCGHGKSYHYKNGRKVKAEKNCRLCDCPKWVAGVCHRCGGWTGTWSTYRCWDCYQLIARLKSKGRLALYNTPANVAERERAEQIRWLNRGRKTLSQVRHLLRHPEALRLQQQVSQQERTSHGL